MKKDYVYQNKGQYKMMYNAHKIGGFLVSDQDVILDEQVLPEQRFAHQPIFRRLPEEVIEMTYLALNSGAKVYPGKFKFNKSVTPKRIEHHSFAGRTHSSGEMAGHRDHTLWHKNPEDSYWAGKPLPIGGSGSGSAVIWQDKHLWQVHKRRWMENPNETGPGGLYHATLTVPKNGKVYAKDFKIVLQLPNFNQEYLSVYWTYKNAGGDFVILLSWVDTSVAWYDIKLIEYSASNPEGPWVWTGNIWDIGLTLWAYWASWPRNITPIDTIVKELATFIRYKPKHELQLGYAHGNEGGVAHFYEWILREAFVPPWYVIGGDGPEPPSSLADIIYMGSWKNKDIIQIEDTASPYSPSYYSVKRGKAVEPIKDIYDELWYFEHPDGGQPPIP